MSGAPLENKTDIVGCPTSADSIRTASENPDGAPWTPGIRDKTNLNKGVNFPELTKHRSQSASDTSSPEPLEIKMDSRRPIKKFVPILHVPIVPGPRLNMPSPSEPTFGCVSETYVPTRADSRKGDFSQGPKSPPVFSDEEIQAQKDVELAIWLKEQDNLPTSIANEVAGTKYLKTAGTQTDFEGPQTPNAKKQSMVSTILQSSDPEDLDIIDSLDINQDFGVIEVVEANRHDSAEQAREDSMQASRAGPPDINTTQAGEADGDDPTIVDTHVRSNTPVTAYKADRLEVNKADAANTNKVNPLEANTADNADGNSADTVNVDIAGPIENDCDALSQVDKGGSSGENTADPTQDFRADMIRVTRPKRLRWRSDTI